MRRAGEDDPDEPSRPAQDEKVTAKRMLKNLKLWVFLAANGGSRSTCSCGARAREGQDRLERGLSGVEREGERRTRGP